MYFGIFDEIRVKNLDLKGKESILIRIFEPDSYDKVHSLIINSSCYTKILKLYIYDYVNDIEFGALDDTFNLLNDFIVENEFDEVIVHCSLGISRSPAIMICIAKILKNKDLENYVKGKFKFYNKFIVQEFERYSYKIKEKKDNNFWYAYDNRSILTEGNILDEDNMFNLPQFNKFNSQNINSKIKILEKNISYKK